MSSLLTLAKDLEQQSKAQQQGTGPYAQSLIKPARAVFHSENHRKRKYNKQRNHPQLE
ncbi:MbeB family mobilization protein [Enterobacter intestinihominis]